MFEALNELEKTLNVPLTSAAKGTRPVRKDMEFPLDKFTQYMKVSVPARPDEIALDVFVCVDPDM